MRRGCPLVNTPTDHLENIFWGSDPRGGHGGHGGHRRSDAIRVVPQPTRGSRVDIHVPPRPSAWNPCAPANLGFFFQRSRPRGWPWWPWWPSTIGRVQISDAAVRANAWLWFGLGAHPGGLGVHNARDTPCPKPEACPAHRRTSVQARPYRLRSARNATRRPGAAGRWYCRVWSSRAGAGPPLTGTQELHKLHRCLWMRRNPWQWHEPAEPMGDRHDAHVASTEPVPPERGRCVAHGRSDGTTAPQGDASCGADACCWYLLEGG